MRYSKYLFILLFSTLFCIISTNKIHAATDITLTPVEYIDSTVFDIDVNTNNTSTNGITLILQMSGDITVQDVTEGTTGLCGTFDVQKTDTKISITCLENEAKAINGTIAKISATVGNTYSINIVEDTSDFGELTIGKITNIDVEAVQETTQEVQSKSYLLLYISGAAFVTLLIVLILVIMNKKRTRIS